MFPRKIFGAMVLGAMPFCSLALTPGLCYRPDGTQMDDTYRPCNTNGVSMCCHLAFSNNGGDACGSGQSYGLCGVTGDQLWRESCTDSTWRDPACLQLCVGAGYRGDDAKITKCVDGSYCCGYNNATCCSRGDGVWIVNNQVQLDNPSSSGSIPFISSSMTTTTTATATTPTTPTSGAKTTTETADTGSADSGGGGTSPGVAAGIGVGAAIGAVLLLALGVLFFWKTKNAPKNNSCSSSSSSSNNNSLLPSNSPSELMGSSLATGTPKHSPSGGMADYHAYCQPELEQPGPDGTNRYPQEMMA